MGPNRSSPRTCTGPACSPMRVRMGSRPGHDSSASCAWSVQRGIEGVGRRVEHRERRVALAPVLDQTSAVLADRARDDRLVTDQRDRHEVGVLLPQGRRVRDVGEEEAHLGDAGTCRRGQRRRSDLGRGPGRWRWGSPSTAASGRDRGPWPSSGRPVRGCTPSSRDVVDARSLLTVVDRPSRKVAHHRLAGPRATQRAAAPAGRRRPSALRRVPARTGAHRSPSRRGGRRGDRRRPPGRCRRRRRAPVRRRRTSS